MLDLTNYLPTKVIDLARLAAQDHLLEPYLPDDPMDIRHMVRVSPEIKPKLPIADTPDWLMLHAIGKVLDGGAKVIKPSLALCRVCQEIELHLELADYAQPFPGLGFILPGSLIAQPRDFLACLYWAPGNGIFLGVYVPAEVPYLLFNGFSPHYSGTLEQALTGNHDPRFLVDGQNETDVQRITRICTNLALFAVERGHTIEPLSKDGVRRRRRAERDDRLGRLIAREVQEVVVQDLELFLKETRKSETVEPTGSRQSPHRRRGHWKMQFHGAGRQFRKRIFVQSYLVGFNDPGKANVETTLS